MIKAAKKTYREIIKSIADAKSVLITAHKGPDGDSIGSQLALARYIRDQGKEVTIINDGSIPDKYKFLPDLESIVKPPNGNTKYNFDLAIILECPDVQRTGDVADMIGNGTKLINIDHHSGNTDFADINLVDSDAAAVGVILAEIFFEAGFKIDSDTAALLYTAILTDTGRFRFESTTPRTMEIAGKLIDAGANPRQICDDIYYSLSETVMKLTGKVFSRVRLFEDGKVCLISLDRKLLEDNEFSLTDTDGMAEYTLYLRGVMVGAMLREIETDITKVSLRSRGNIDVRSLASEYGGGGHFNAAGCTINLPINSAEEKLLVDLGSLVK